MMKLSHISGKKVIRTLKIMGYEEIRVRGSYHYLISGTGSLVTVPVHSGKTLAPKTLQSILQVAKTQAEFDGPE